MTRRHSMGAHHHSPADGSVCDAGNACALRPRIPRRADSGPAPQRYARTVTHHRPPLDGLPAQRRERRQRMSFLQPVRRSVMPRPPIRRSLTEAIVRVEDVLGIRGSLNSRRLHTEPHRVRRSPRSVGHPRHSRPHGFSGHGRHAHHRHPRRYGEVACGTPVATWP